MNTETRKLKLTAVSYLNTKPFIYGLYRSEMAGQFDLSLDIPSECARKLKSGEVDLALAPVAIIPELEEAYLVSNYCIGATGAVNTVCVFSEVPLREIKKLYLDFHSRSSVALTRLLCSEYWHVTPELVPATEGFEREIGGDTAALIIGDRTIGLHDRFPYVYDLAEAWTAWTGLPFVFAAWIAVKPLPEDILRRFNAALEAGIRYVPELVKVLPDMPQFDLEYYYRHYISYELDEAKWLGLNRFLTTLAGEKGYNLKRQVF